MKKLLALFVPFLFLFPVAAHATPVSWDYAGGILQPLQSMWTAFVKADHFQATSTTASSTLPNLETTQLKVGSASGLLKRVSGFVTTATAGTDYQAPVTLTTTGSSGAATFISNTLNIPQYTSGGTPGGLNTQVQYNNAGAFGGVSGATTNGTILNLTNPLLGGATITTSTVNGVTLTTGGSATSYLNGTGAYSVPVGTTYSAGTGLTLTTTTFSVNTSQNIATLSNLTGNGYVKTSGGVGTLSVQGVPIPIADGGTNATSQTTNGVNYFNGTSITSGTTLTFDGTTLGSGPHTITSSSANALAVGPSGATNPTLAVDSSTASSITGVAIKSAATGGGVSITATDSAGATELKLASKGGSAVRIQPGGTTRFSFFGSTAVFTPQTSNVATDVPFALTLPTAATLTASTDSMMAYFNGGVIRTHATGALALQRDVRITPSTHAFVGASALTTAAALAIDGPPVGGTNATIGTSTGIYLPTSVLANTTTGIGLYAEAPTGATSANYAAMFNGNVAFPQRGTAAGSFAAFDPNGVLISTTTPGGGGGAVSSVSNADGTLTISPTTGAVVASLALGHANTWTGQQTFNTSAPIFGTMTLGSVLFAGTSGILSQDNSNFFWDNTNKRLGLSDITPDYRLESVGSTGNGYFGVTSSVDGDIFNINTTGFVGIGSTTPYGLLSVASSTWSSNVPLFTISTSSDSFGLLASVYATTSTLQNIAFIAGDISSMVDSGVRFVIGSFEKYRLALDQLNINGRINTGDWALLDCEGGLGLINTVTSNTSQACGPWAFRISGTGVFGNIGFTTQSTNVQIGTNAGGVSSAAITAGSATTAQIAMSMGTTTPILEAAVSMGTRELSAPSNNASSTVFVGFTSQQIPGTTEPLQGCYFTASSTQNNFWAVCRSSASAVTMVDTTISSTTAQYTRFRVEMDNSKGVFYVQTPTTAMRKVTTITGANYPSATRLSPIIQIVRPVAGNIAVLGLSYAKLWFKKSLWPEN